MIIGRRANKRTSQNGEVLLSQKSTKYKKNPGSTELSEKKKKGAGKKIASCGAGV